jgi:predicted N-formylglutamate amidohydrolase
MKCIITCEHASRRVPPHFAHLFEGNENVLLSHQAYDQGAAKLARRLAKQLHASVHLGSISRLLIDLNRSPSNRKSLFNTFSRKLEQDERELLVQKYYLPYRNAVEETLAGIIAEGRPVLHISVHSFVPEKSGKVRNAEIGLLYDPGRKCEKDISSFLAGLLQKQVVSLRVRRNYPYLGKTDGFTSYLRRKYSAKQYAGIELEINQAFLLKNDSKKKQAVDVFTEGVMDILQLKKFALTAKKV